MLDVSLLDPGNGLLAVCLVCSAAAVVLSVPKVSRHAWKGETLPVVMGVASFISVTGSLTVLVWASLSSDFDYLYVWEHSSAGLEPLYKLSAVWAGGEGSLLLCTWLISLVYVIETVGRRSSLTSGTRLKDVFGAVMCALVAFFSFNVLVSGLFDPTGAMLLTAHPDGLGMDVTLQTPEMVLHAPLIFGAYAALAAVFSASVAYHVAGDKQWHRIGLPWGRLGWLLLTAGIGLGAVWAYYVIGWGGYWAWDPVETSSLVPWLLITAFLHTQSRQLRKGEYEVASPMFGMLAFVGVVFVSFVVRAGGLWSSSIHDYGASESSSAVSRLISLVQEDPSVAGTMLFMLSLLVMASYLSVRSVRKAGHRPPAPAPKHLSGYITDQNVMFLAVTLLTLAALAAIALMFKNIQSDQAATFAELDQKMSVIFVALLVTLGLCLGWRLAGRDRILYVSTAIAGLSVALAVAGGLSGSYNAMVAFALPSFLFAMAASAMRLAKSVASGSVRSRVFKAGAQVIHIGVALIVMSYVVSSNLQSYPSAGSEIGVIEGSNVLVGDYTVRVVDIYALDVIYGYPDGVDQVIAVSVDIYKDGKLVEEGATLEVLYGHDPGSGYLEVVEKIPFVRSSLYEDLYLSFDWMFSGAVLLHAKVVPMMVPLWTGVLLLLSGLAMRFWTFEPPGAPRNEKS